MDFFNKNTTIGDVPTIVLSSFESLIIPTPFTQWQELRIAMCASLTTDNEYNANMNDYSTQGGSHLRYDYINSFLFGLKKTKTINPFYDPNDVFWGIQPYRMDISSEHVDFTMGSFSANGSDVRATSDGDFLCRDYKHDDSSQYSTYIGLKYVKNGDNVTINYGRSRDRTYSKTYFLNFLNTSSYNIRGSYGTKTISNPNNDSLSVMCFYWPFLNIRLRLHAISARIFS